MNKLLIIFISWWLISCSKDESIPISAISYIIPLLIHTSQTDTSYVETNKSHYIVRNTNIHVNKLLLFIGGSYSTPENYHKFCDYSASIGLDVISLSYPNSVPAFSLGSNVDIYVFDNYRDEICFGNPASNVVAVDSVNSINSRTIKLLEYLLVEYPDQHWEQYLTSNHHLAWNNIIVSGHSQGAGHACYLGKKNVVNRVVMFSGPNDFHTLYEQPANWLTQSGETPWDKQYVLLHMQDQVVPFSIQVDNLRGLGLLSSSQIPVVVDDLSFPFENENVLSINTPALSYHNATVGINGILPDIWSYLLVNN